MGIVVAAVVVIGLVGLIVYGIISKRKRERAMLSLATKNGWIALGKDDAALRQYLPQYIGMLGQQNYGFGSYSRTHSSYDMAYQATIGNHTAVMFQYEYTEYQSNADPQQPETSTTRFFTILNVTMPFAEPTILLLHHDFVSKLVNLGLHTGLWRIGLEGNFNQYYDTYIMPNGQVEALSILTPDVMEQVMALAGTRTHASMQMSGQSTIISFENQLLTPEFIEPLMEQVRSLLAKLDAKPHVGSSNGLR